MEQKTIQIDEKTIPLFILEAAVIGSGCAGYNAADWLFDLGVKDMAVFTEGVKMGTSRNTGSDKQTYYKLALSGDDDDSSGQMGNTLFSYGGIHGDTALCEAANSTRSFMKLVNLGVPFPANEYGEYVGYKTDHDPQKRATSAGPLTSKYMTEALERSVNKKNIPVFDRMTVVRLLVEDNKIRGFLALFEDLKTNPPLADLEIRSGVDKGTYCGLCAVLANSIILATGGPAGCYGLSVYPISQTGMSGMAIEAGAWGANLQEWQYGLASTDFRWNVSGTYQQVLPRYISLDEQGTEREFLPDYFSSFEEGLNRVFLKGYQWPFDVKKVDGSSMIDLIVYHEIFALKRRVFLDFRRDPAGMEKDFSALSEEAYNYLRQSGALEKTPIRRLEIMNPLSIDLYKSHHIDLYREPLEISVCAQHHNGGLWVDANWQTSVRGLYAVGEAAGIFGPYRPGGSALNSTQVGSLRAAEHIARKRSPKPPGLSSSFEKEIRRILTELGKIQICKDEKGAGAAREKRKKYGFAFSRIAAHIRDIDKMREWEKKIDEELDSFFEKNTAANQEEIRLLFQNRDILITQKALISAMIFSAEELGSRGSALILDPNGKSMGIGDIIRKEEVKEESDKQVITRISEKMSFSSSFQKVRPLPESGGWFENVWREYRERKP